MKYQLALLSVLWMTSWLHASGTDGDASGSDSGQSDGNVAVKEDGVKLKLDGRSDDLLAEADEWVRVAQCCENCQLVDCQCGASSDTAARDASEVPVNFRGSLERKLHGELSEDSDDYDGANASRSSSAEAIGSGIEADSKAVDGDSKAKETASGGKRIHFRTPLESASDCASSPPASSSARSPFVQRYLQAAAARAKSKCNVQGESKPDKDSESKATPSFTSSAPQEPAFQKPAAKKPSTGQEDKKKGRSANHHHHWQRSDQQQKKYSHPQFTQKSPASQQQHHHIFHCIPKLVVTQEPVEWSHFNQEEVLQMGQDAHMIPLNAQPLDPFTTIVFADDGIRVSDALDPTARKRSLEEQSLWFMADPAAMIEKEKLRVVDVVTAMKNLYLLRYGKQIDTSNKSLTSWIDLERFALSQNNNRCVRILIEIWIMANLTRPRGRRNRIVIMEVPQQYHMYFYEQQFDVEILKKIGLGNSISTAGLQSADDVDDDTGEFSFLSQTRSPTNYPSSKSKFEGASHRHSATSSSQYHSHHHHQGRSRRSHQVPDDAKRSLGRPNLFINPSQYGNSLSPKYEVCQSFPTNLDLQERCAKTGLYMPFLSNADVKPVIADFGQCSSLDLAPKISGSHHSYLDYITAGFGDLVPQVTEQTVQKYWIDIDPHDLLYDDSGRAMPGTLLYSPTAVALLKLTRTQLMDSSWRSRKSKLWAPIPSAPFQTALTLSAADSSAAASSTDAQMDDGGRPRAQSDADYRKSTEKKSVEPTAFGRPRSTSLFEKLASYGLAQSARTSSSNAAAAKAGGVAKQPSTTWMDWHQQERATKVLEACIQHSKVYNAQGVSWAASLSDDAVKVGTDSLLDRQAKLAEIKSASSLKEQDKLEEAQRTARRAPPPFGKCKANGKASEDVEKMFEAKYRLPSGDPMLAPRHVIRHYLIQQYEQLLCWYCQMHRWMFYTQKDEDIFQQRIARIICETGLFSYQPSDDGGAKVLKQPFDSVPSMEGYSFNTNPKTVLDKEQLIRALCTKELKLSDVLPCCSFGPAEFVVKEQRASGVKEKGYVPNQVIAFPRALRNELKLSRWHQSVRDERVRHAKKIVAEQGHRLRYNRANAGAVSEETLFDTLSAIKSERKAAQSTTSMPEVINRPASVSVKDRTWEMSAEHKKKAVGKNSPGPVGYAFDRTFFNCPRPDYDPPVSEDDAMKKAALPAAQAVYSDAEIHHLRLRNLIYADLPEEQGKHYWVSLRGVENPDIRDPWQNFEMMDSLQEEESRRRLDRMLKQMVAWKAESTKSSRYRYWHDKLTQIKLAVEYTQSALDLSCLLYSSFRQARKIIKRYCEVFEQIILDMFSNNNMQPDVRYFLLDAIGIDHGYSLTWAFLPNFFALDGRDERDESNDMSYVAELYPLSIFAQMQRYPVEVWATFLYSHYRCTDLNHMDLYGKGEMPVIESGDVKDPLDWFRLMFHAIENFSDQGLDQYYRAIDQFHILMHRFFPNDSTVA